MHDTPLISKDIPLATGMIITIEPGVYVPLTDPSKFLFFLFSFFLFSSLFLFELLLLFLFVPFLFFSFNIIKK